MKKIALVLFLAFSFSSVTHAAKVDGAPAPNCEGLKMATGPGDKGYSKLFSDMSKISNGKLQLCEVRTTGGLDNLTALSEKQADLGIVQIDTLKTMQAGDDNVAALQVVMALNNNFLHVVTSANGYTFAGEKKYLVLAGDSKTVRITAFSQLRGQRVALVGSAQLLGRQLNKQLGYGMIFTDVDGKDADKKAFDMVKKGQVYAAFTVSGWQHGAIKTLTQDDGLTLVPFDAPISAPYTVKPFNYKNIGVYNVQALAVQNVLVTRPFSGAKVQDVAMLKRIIADNLNELKDGDFQPAWNEIKNVDTSVDWPRFNGVPRTAKK